MENKVTLIGEALIDIVIPAAGEAVEHVGGSPANVAIGLARLGHEACLATYIGTDERGTRIAELMASESVALLPGSTTAARTPTAAAYLDDRGAATYQFDLHWELNPDLVTPAVVGHVHTGSIGAALPPGAAGVREVLQRSHGAHTVSYDPNARPTLMGDPEQVRILVEDLVRLSDVVKASDEDAAWLYPDSTPEQVLRVWADLGPAICAITQGGAEVLVLAAGELRHYPTKPTTVADTVGAGDSFMAGLLSGLIDADLLGDATARRRLREADWTFIEPAVERALSCAAITVSRNGANPPRRNELPA